MGGITLNIEGDQQLKALFEAIPEDLQPSVIRNIARGPGNKVVSMARRLFTPKKTGKSRRQIGILKVKSNAQKYIEVGVKGRSLVYIFAKGATRKDRGVIEPLGNIIQQAADSVGPEQVAQMKIDLVKVIQKSFRIRQRK